MKREIIKLLSRENFINLKEEEKNLINELFTEVVDENLDGSINIIDFRYYINNRFWVECYGKELADAADETIYEIDFSENNHFRFYEMGKEIDLDSILLIERKLKKINDLTKKLDKVLFFTFGNNFSFGEFDFTAHWKYIYQKMPKGFFDVNGKLNLEYDESTWMYDYWLGEYIDILKEEIDEYDIWDLY